MSMASGLGIGPRTRRNILKGRNIRKHQDGGDVYEDYWTDSDNDESSTNSTKSNFISKSQAGLNSSNVDSLNEVIEEEQANLNSSKVDSLNEVIEEQQANLNSLNEVIEKQQATLILGTPNVKPGLSKSNIAELGDTVLLSKRNIKKSSLLLKEVSEKKPHNSKKSIMATKTKNAAQMEEILPRYDEVDLQIMQMFHGNNSATDNESSYTHQKSLNKTNANKTTEESEHIHGKGISEDRRESADESPNEDRDEYDLELLAKKLGNVPSDVSSSQDLNKNVDTLNSVGNMGSDVVKGKPALSQKKHAPNVSRKKKESASHGTSLKNSNRHRHKKNTEINENSLLRKESFQSDSTVKGKSNEASKASPNKNSASKIKSCSQGKVSANSSKHNLINATEVNENITQEKENTASDIVLKRKSHLSSCASPNKCTFNVSNESSSSEEEDFESDIAMRRKSACVSPYKHISNVTDKTGDSSSEEENFESDTAVKKKKHKLHVSHISFNEGTKVGTKNKSNLRTKPLEDSTSHEEIFEPNIATKRKSVRVCDKSISNANGKISGKENFESNIVTRRKSACTSPNKHISNVSSQIQGSFAGEENVKFDIATRKSSARVFPKKATSNVTVKRKLRNASRIYPKKGTEVGTKNKSNLRTKPLKSSTLDEEILESDIATRSKSVYVSPNKHISNVTGRIQDSFAGEENVESENTTRRKSASVSHNKHISNITGQIQSPTSGKEGFESDIATRRKSARVSPNQYVSNVTNKTTNSFSEEGNFELDTAVKIKKRKLHTSYVSHNKEPKVGTKKKTFRVKSLESSTSDEEDFESDSATRKKSTCVSPNKHVSNETGKINSSSHGDTKANSSKHTRGTNKTYEVDNSFRQITTKKRKTIVHRRKENYEIHPLNEAGASEDIHTSVTTRDSLSMRKQTHKGKKNSKKLNNVSKSTECIRRSSRERYLPLAHWRNERLQYRCEKGQIKVLGIAEGTKLDDAAVQFLNKIRERQKIKSNIPTTKKAKLIDVVKNEKISADVIKRFSLTPWLVIHEDSIQPQHRYLVKKIFETNKTAFGFIQIDINKEKPQQYMPDEDLQMTVITGDLEFTIQKNSYKLTAKDMFIVPRGCYYSVKNIGKIKALLSFAVGKFQFIENLDD